ncbi:HEAT repeat domain-containing protein [Candidatus Uabimicrobium amorphum]|uniref:Clathrin/coatomer adaptor adaptin-like N-terminal domain-containing protein n=1 Tax=Uabimicrobium amorphum TaxID=2596890 RepID=A0A5S9IQG5_UABAM|nr:HEAT repeat domain-containing protein [Candidatus Uabimicrobium amorphum]BBM84805.1 hypothetical protein UABAM_03166 [Candidatus Uabimicrobium amorphum]
MILRLCLLLMFLSIINFTAAQNDDFNDNVQKHIKKLQSENSRAKLSSIIALGKLGPKAKAAVPKLIKCLEDKNTRIILWTIKSLQKMGIAAVPELKKALRSANKKTQCRILRIFTGLEVQALSMLPDLNEFLYDEDPCLQTQTLKLLAIVPEKGGDSVSRLSQLVMTGTNEVKILAAKAMGALGKKAQETTRILIEALQKERENEDVCAAIVASLAEVGELPLVLQVFNSDEDRLHIIRVFASLKTYEKETIPLLIKALQDQNRSVVYEARQVLKKMGGAALPFILKELENEKSSLVLPLIYILGGMDGSIVDAIPVLLKMTKHSNVNIKYQAKNVLLKIDIQYTAAGFIAMLRSADADEVMTGLGLLSKSGDGCIPWLIKALREPDIQKYAYELLAQRAASAVPLAKSLKDQDPEIRKLTEKLLCRLRPVSAAINICIGYLENEEIRPHAKKILVTIGSLAAKQLITFLKTDNDVLRQQVKLLLKEMPRQSIYFLLRSSNDESVKEQVVGLLMELSPKNVEHILDAYDQLYQEVPGRVSRRTLLESQKTVVQILQKMGAPGTIAVLKKIRKTNRVVTYLKICDSLDTSDVSLIPVLCGVAKHGNDRVRIYALRTLAKMGKKSLPALPTIRSFIKNYPWKTKKAALDTLEAMGNETISVLTDLFRHGDSRLKMHVAQKLYRMVPQRVDKITGYNEQVYKAFDAFEKLEKDIVRRYDRRSRRGSDYLEFTVVFSDSNAPVFCFAISRGIDLRQIVLYDVDKQEKRIIFSDNPKSDTDLKYLKEIQCISQLELHSPQITDKGFAYLPEFSNVKTLRIFAPCKITKKFLESLQKMHSLEELSLLAEISDAELALLRNLPKLKTLYLQSSKVTSLQPIASFSHLRTLYLRKVQSNSVVHLKKLASLQNLHLLNMNISVDDIRELSTLKNLEKLSLSVSTIYDKHLVHLSKFQKLSDLDLSRTMITDSGMKIIDGLENITRLSISHTEVTDKGVLLLQDNRNLKRLQVSANIDKKTIDNVGHNSVRFCEVHVVQ